MHSPRGARRAGWCGSMRCLRFRRVQVAAAVRLLARASSALQPMLCSVQAAEAAALRLLVDESSALQALLCSVQAAEAVAAVRLLAHVSSLPRTALCSVQAAAAVAAASHALTNIRLLPPQPRLRPCLAVVLVQSQVWNAHARCGMC